MTLVALANALLDDRMVVALSPRLARAGDRAAAAGTAAARRAGARSRVRSIDDPRGRRCRRPPVRRYRTPHTVFPHAQFLSNGRLVSVVTNAGGGSLLRDGLAMTRSRRDATLDPGSMYLYLRDVWSGDVWSATYQPTAVEPDDYLVTFRPDRATIPPPRRHDRQPARHRRVDRRRRRSAPARRSPIRARARARST